MTLGIGVFQSLVKYSFVILLYHVFIVFIYIFTWFVKIKENAKCYRIVKILTYKIFITWPLSSDIHTTFSSR